MMNKPVIKLVLADDEIAKLQKKLDIAIRALKEYANCKPTEWMTCVTAEKALKAIELVGTK